MLSAIGRHIRRNFRFGEVDFCDCDQQPFRMCKRASVVVYTWLRHHCNINIFVQCLISPGNTHTQTRTYTHHTLGIKLFSAQIIRGALLSKFEFALARRHRKDGTYLFPLYSRIYHSGTLRHGAFITDCRRECLQCTAHTRTHTRTRADTATLHYCTLLLLPLPPYATAHRSKHASPPRRHSTHTHSHSKHTWTHTHTAAAAEVAATVAWIQLLLPPVCKCLERMQTLCKCIRVHFDAMCVCECVVFAHIWGAIIPAAMCESVRACVSLCYRVHAWTCITNTFNTHHH